MKEDLLQFIWKHQLFDHHALFTAEGEPTEILKPGIQNPDSGPDFSDARIKIGTTLWAGNIEIHINSSDWTEHKHHLDPAYKNVILHVVLKDDQVLKNDISKMPPLLEIGGKINPQLLEKYRKMMESVDWIPCQSNLQMVRSITKSKVCERLLVERLESKYMSIMEIVKFNNYDWHESFHQALARSFGFNVNADAFEKLAMITPLKILLQRRNDLFFLESLLFGQSSLIEGSFTDDYPLSLKKEYEFQKKKFDFQPMNKSMWKFARLRPANFPTIRIAQFSSLLNHSNNLLSLILEATDLAEMYDLFTAEASSYWLNHFVFDKAVEKYTSKILGDKSIEILLSNTAIPFMFVYGRERKNEHFTDKALRFLEKMKAEKNGILTTWQQLGFENKNAFDSQALLYLKKSYCNQKKCLNCGIGNDILSYSF